MQRFKFTCGRVELELATKKLRFILLYLFGFSSMLAFSQGGIHSSTIPDLITISSNDAMHFAWYKDGTVSTGSSDDLDNKRTPYPFSLAPGKTIADLICISSNDAMHFAWYKDGTVSAGSSDDLDNKREPYPFVLAPGRTIDDLVCISSNDAMHFAWYKDGTVSSGSSDNLANRRAPYRYTLATGRSASDVISISSNDAMHFAWYNDFSVSTGSSEDLDNIRQPYGFTLKQTPDPAQLDTIVSISSNDAMHFAWYKDGTVTAGSSDDLDNKRSPYQYTLAPGKSVGDLICISSNDAMHFAWYKDGTVSAGSSDDLDNKRALYKFSLASGKTINDLICISSNDAMHFAWYKDGTVSAGSSDDLDNKRAPYRYSLAPGRSVADVYTVSSNDAMHFAWYKNGTVSTGSSDDLDRTRAPYGFSLYVRGGDKSNYSVKSTVAVNRLEKWSNGQSVGSFYQTGAKEWIEIDLQENKRSWTEIYRDEWSVYLKDFPQKANIQLDLHTKRVMYWEDNEANDVRALYSIANPSNLNNGYMVTLVTHAQSGHMDKFGEFARVTNNIWKEIGVSGDINVFRETHRDEWSVYLFDDSRNIFIALDLYLKKVKYRARGDGNYSNLYDIIDTYSMIDPPQAGILNFPGSSQSISVEGLKAVLKKEGLTLIQTGTLGENQCAVLFPSSDMEDISAQFGVLACNQRINDDLRMQVQVVHGYCDVSSLNQGIGSECAMTVGKAELTFRDKNGAEYTYGISGPSANQCTGLSTERLCANVGASVAGVEMKDRNGNGIGLSVDAGIGAGLSQSYSEGVLTLGFDLKFVVGGSMSLSVNLEEIASNPASALLQLGETGYLISGGVFRAASGPLKSLFSATMGEAAVVPNTAISLVTECPWDVFKWMLTGEDVDCLD